MTIARDEYEVVLKNDLTSFIERSFYELNPQTQLSPQPSHRSSCLPARRLPTTETPKRLIVTMPPRSLKSHCVSMALPAFLLGHNPAAQIICVSYGQDLADKLARDSRTVMGSAFYQENLSSMHG
jgi:hypothetical protein